MNFLRAYPRTPMEASSGRESLNDQTVLGRALRNTLPLWMVLALVVPRVATAGDRTPPPPGPKSHRAPPARPGVHKAPPAHPGVHKAPPAHPFKPKNPSKPKNPGPKKPGKPPGGGHPSPPPKKGIGKPWWGPMTKPGFWLDRPWHGHRPHHPGHHPAPHHPDPHSDPDWYPRPMPVDPDFGHDWGAPEMPGGPLKLLNESGGTIQCRINGKMVSLRPGVAVPLAAGRLWLIEFRRGGEFGVARYELTHGIHEFIRTGHGWDLVRIGPGPIVGDPHAGLPENPMY